MAVDFGSFVWFPRADRNNGRFLSGKEQRGNSIFGTLQGGGGGRWVCRDNVTSQRGVLGGHYAHHGFVCGLEGSVGSGRRVGAEG